MTDFMKWLYAHYIQPEVAAAPHGDYEMYFSLLENELEPPCWEAYQKALEFAAAHAFELGVRTGCGLDKTFTA